MRNVGQQVSETLLPRIRRPGQYIGLETNACCGDVGTAEVTVVMAFPDTYGIGISHLGSQILYHMLNHTPGVACDRTYCPLPDAETVMRSQEIPLFGWETRCAIRDFDVVGFSLGHEMCITNMLTMLDLAGIPLHSLKRGERDPIVIAGDTLADTPEPIADFVDLFLVGDGEEPLGAFVELIRQMKRSRAGRDDIILEAAKTIPSAYAPRYYRPRFNEDGIFAGMEPLRDDVPPTVEHAHLRRLSDSPPLTAPLVPISEAVHERVMIEIMRGCPNACRFCQAGTTRLPVRHRSVDEIIDIARKAIAKTGFREISLLSLSASDYPRLDKLIGRLNDEFVSQHVSISLPSLRVDSQLRQLPRLTSTVRKGGLTIAVEAASQRLRRAIRKNITDENMIAGVHAGYEAGWRRVKVYFIAGLPGETDSDIDAIFDLCRGLSDTRKDVDGNRGRISGSVAWLVPKPHTPMQWCAMREPEYFFSVRRRLRELSRRSPVRFRFHRIERSILEGVISRGDRRVGAVIEAAWKNGARLDAWDEYFDYSKWEAAFEQTGLDPSFYVHRETPTTEILPWAHIHGTRTTQFLLDEYRRMMEALEV